MKLAAGTTPTANRRRFRHLSARARNIVASGTIATGARLARIRIAAPAAAPLARAAHLPDRRAMASESAQNAAAGMSLIGELVSWNRKAGLVDRSAAAVTPAHRSLSWRPRSQVAQTVNAARSGTTANTALAPPASSNTAISIGNPGDVTGTMVAPSGDGR